MMPGIDGYCVLEDLAKKPTTKSIPFIFLSAKVEKADLRKGMELGADDYLFKPFDTEDLLKSIDARLQRVEALRAEIHKEGDKVNSEKMIADGKLFIQENGKPQLIRIKEISHIIAERQYTSIKLINGKSYLVRKSINYWEGMLSEKSFLRIHRSTIINIEHLVKMEKWYNSSYLVYLQNLTQPLVISKRYASKIRGSFI